MENMLRNMGKMLVDLGLDPYDIEIKFKIDIKDDQAAEFHRRVDGTYWVDIGEGPQQVKTFRDALRLIKEVIDGRQEG